MVSDPEEALATQLDWAGLPKPVREYVFAPPRRWRFDFAWPDRRVAVEVEGGSYVGGRHTTPAGYEKDAEKYNAAALAGWLVLRVVPHMVRDGRAIAYVEQAMIRPTEEA